MNEERGEATRKPIRVDDCPCTVRDCPILGDCIACVSGHRAAKNHLPECMQDIVRDLIRGLAEKIELRVEEGRPGA